MSDLKGFQKKFLRALAHEMDPVVYIGYKGVTDSVIQSLTSALETHELVKVRFNDFKEQKKELAGEMGEKTGSEIVGMIGHTVLFYRQNEDSEKRKINLPKRKS